MIKTDAISIIEDCSLFYQNLFDQVPPLVQKDVWRNVAKFVLSLVGIEEIEQQNDSS